MTNKGFGDGVVVGFWEQQFYRSGGYGWWEWQVGVYEFESQCCQMHKGNRLLSAALGLCFILFGLEACLLGKRNWKNNLEKENQKGN